MIPAPISRMPTKVATRPHMTITAEKLTTSLDVNDVFVAFPMELRNPQKIPILLNWFQALKSASFYLRHLMSQVKKIHG
jgi:hypothetical protein